MIILGIETSCDETAAAIIRCTGNRVEVLSNVVASQMKIHAPWGGVVPTLAKREHQRNLPIVVKKALKKAGFATEPTNSPREIPRSRNFAKGEIISQGKNTKSKILNPVDVIAVTVGPGLEPALWTGINFAAGLAKKWNKPIVAVNHMEGHIASVFLPREMRSNPVKAGLFHGASSKFPILALLVSGGHTELVLMHKWLDYQVIGSTRDDAAGEAFDKVAKMLGLGYPGGPVISAYAEKLKVKSEKSKVNLPRPMINSRDYDFSFSGLKTAARYKLEELGKISKGMKREFCAEFQQAVIDVLIAKTIRAAKEFKVKTIILAGGVSANLELRKQIAATIKGQLSKVNCHMSELQYTGDNAAMIALAAYFRARKKQFTKSEDLKAEGNLTLNFKKRFSLN